jgi:hypothetical protein
MAISINDYNQRVQAWLNERWPPNNPCPMCHTASGWELGVPGDIILRLDLEGSVPGRALPVVPLICARCGYVVLLGAIKVGLFASDNAPDLPAPDPGQDGSQ